MSRLRVGLLVGKAGPRAWHEQVITILAGHEAIELAGIGRMSEGRMSERATEDTAAWRWLDRLETAFSHRLFRSRRADAALAPDALAGVADIAAADLAPGLDIVIDLEGAPDRLSPAEVGAREIWHLTFDGLGRPIERAGLAGWQQGRHVVEATLWQRDGDTAPVPIERAFFGIFKPSWSVNRSRLLWRAALLITDNVLRRAETGDTPARGDAGDPALPETPAAASAPIPSPFRLGLRLASRLADHVYRKLLVVEQWQVLATPSAADMLKPEAYARLEPPPDRFWADPFAIRRRDRDYIFVEELRYKEDKGEIAVLEHRDGELLDARTIIAEPYHMSYPCIIEHEDELYMVPETRQKRSIDIWKNIAFPDRWTPVGTLMDDVSAGDTTLFRHDGRWWMFTNLSRTRHLRSADELHAFYTDDPSPVTGDWIAHRRNPLVRDTRFARQGGRVFTDEHGRLIRSAQDTAVRYGYAVLFFHVERLTRTDYAETLLHKVEPDWHDDVVGMHTFERSGDLCIFDACFAKPRLRLPL